MTLSFDLLGRAASRVATFAALALALAGLPGCGGGGTQLASGGIVGTGDARVLSSGIITATAPGAIVVNGQSVAVAGAAISINGVAASAAELRVGMVVAVDGRVNPDGSATATSVAYRAEVSGVVDGVDVEASTFTLLGQRVRTDRLTVIEGGAFASMLGQRVEVSGLRSGPADVYATWIQVSAEPPPAVVPIEVVGTVAALDTTQKRFTVGTQAVDYASLASPSLPPGLANGSKVRVTGTVPVAGGTVTATGISIVAAPLPGQNAHRVELEGFVTDFVSLASFRVSGQPVDAGSARFEDGSAASLANGALVEVEGRLENGIVIASEIEFDQPATVELDGTVQSVDVAAASFVVGGETIAVLVSTQFEDRTATPDPAFGLAKLAVGDRVSVKARAGATGWIALRVERRAPDAPAPGSESVKVEGVISGFVSVADFTVAGQRVNASGASFEEGRASDLAVGVHVEVEGSLSGGILVASKVEVKLNPSQDEKTVKVSGPISAFLSKSSFLVAGQAVDASAATFENGGVNDLANGRTVEATGVVTGGVLRASHVKFASASGGTELEVEGAIESYASPASFRVSGQTVNASGATYKNGTVSDLAVGREVEVKGSLVAGILMATRVEFKDAPEAEEEIEVKGTISSFVSVSNFMVAGRRVDASNAEFDGGEASDLANGRSVEVEGKLAGVVLKAEKVKFR